MDAARRVVPGDLLVVDGRIAALGEGVPAALEALPGRRAEERFDASGCLVLPGLIHAHLHLCQTLFRGLAEQDDLLRWLRERIWPLEHAHTEASIAASARLGVCELLASGATCVNDMGAVRHTEAVASVVEETGVRAVLGKALMDQGEGVPAGMLESAGAALDGGLALAKRWHGRAGGRLQVSLAPRFILSCSEELWRGVRDAARRENLLVHTHLAESPGEGEAVQAAVGESATRYFARHQLLGERFLGAHGVWVDAEEAAVLGSAGAAVAHCPGANLKLGAGIADVRMLRQAGVRVGLGSDGAACNNRLDALEEMRMAALLSRWRSRGRGLSAREVVELATCEGARALGLATRVGSLEVGKEADLTVVSLEAPHLEPREGADPYDALVYAARASDVRLTMVAGRVLYRDGGFTTLDPAEVVAEARAERRGLLRRAA
jgi:5-methylthioadenosine/S-adenosylhomocysteine deaminase